MSGSCQGWEGADPVHYPPAPEEPPTNQLVGSRCFRQAMSCCSSPNPYPGTMSASVLPIRQRRVEQHRRTANLPHMRCTRTISLKCQLRRSASII